MQKEKMTKLGIGLVSVFTILLLICGIFTSDTYLSYTKFKEPATFAFKKTYFNVTSKYEQGYLITEVRGFDVDSKEYDKYDFLLGNDAEVISIKYLDENDFPLAVAPMYKSNIVIRGSELTAFNRIKIDKQLVRKIYSSNITCKQLLLKGE